MFEKILTNLGLTPEQTEIYLSLLNIGAQTASQLAKTTKVKRTYVYKICGELITKGLIRQETKGRATIFIPQSPDYLLETAEQRKQEAQQAKISLENILPTLKNKFSAIDTKPIINYYEGAEGIMKVYKDTLTASQPIYALVQTSKVQPQIYNWVTTFYVKARIKRHIPVKAIVASGTKTLQYKSLDKKELRETKVIPSHKFPFKHEINIYGNKVSLINHHLESKLLAIIIENETIATTFLSWFKLTWSQL